MIAVCDNLFVGSQLDEAGVRGKPDWFVISACKEPYHRDALGYTERAAPKDHPEYLIARRPGRLILNLVDAADPKYIPDEIIIAALGYLYGKLVMGSTKVLLHCNQGKSRSPTLALLYLGVFGNLRGLDYAIAVRVFKSIYPDYAPAAGMAGYAEAAWATWPTLQLGGSGERWQP